MEVIISLLLILLIVCVIWYKCKGNEFFETSDVFPFNLPVSWYQMSDNRYSNDINTIYTISLPDRLHNVVKTTNVLFDDGINTTNILKAFPKTDRNVENHSKKYSLKTGPTACYISHLQCLNHFLKSSHETALIFEDDIFYKDPDVKEKVLNFVKGITEYDPYWDIIFLGYCYETENRKVKTLSDGQVILNLATPKCLHAYIVNKNMARKIVETPMENIPIDRIIMMKIQSGEVKAYGPEVQLFMQNVEEFETTLENYDTKPQFIDPDTIKEDNQRLYS